MFLLFISLPCQFLYLPRKKKSPPRGYVFSFQMWISLLYAKIIKQTKYYNNELTVKVGHFQYLILEFSFELEMNILMILLHPYIGNLIDDELAMEREDIATRGWFFFLGR